MSQDAGETTVVVFDVNVYIDVAGLIGPPFTWGAFDQLVAQVMALPVPYPKDERIDSLRAVAYCRQGKVIDGEPIEVWTSDHIDELLVHKAIQTATAVVPEDRGLGWSQRDALDLLERLVRDLVEDTGGDSLGELKGHTWRPPLDDYEDGYVYETAYRAGDIEVMPRICITRDGDFHDAGLPPRVDVKYPHEFVDYIRKARRPPPGLGPASLIGRRDS
ncbi:hypothetical protein ACP6C7_04170 [Mycolicibacterium septicum]|uniref:PIN domain-containing protein n=1 Tax=Mycolicibacterium septicum TaxID=98668 RepID=A0ABW9LR95_9MYCO